MATPIADRLGALTDKFRLGYFPAYQEMAAEIGPAGRVLEVGVASGGSLEMWQELFPDGLVAGADISAGCRWPEGTVPIVAHQAGPGLPQQAEAVSPGGYDLIVDDASHNGDLSAETFRLLWPLVKPGRWYVLEDWAVGYLSDAEIALLGTSRAAVGGDSMLRLAQSFLVMLGRDSEVTEVRYRFSQAIVRKRP